MVKPVAGCRPLAYSSPEAVQTTGTVAHIAADTAPPVEVLIEHWGKERFKGYSAGGVILFIAGPVPASSVCSRRSALAPPRRIACFPKGVVHPLALDLHSKRWNEFARPGAPVMDFIFTVCDQV